MKGPVSRRSLLQAGAAAAALPSFHLYPRRRAARPAAISSGNGKEAVAIAVAKMREGLPPVDAAVLGIEPVENDPNDDSVGYGGLPNEEGVVELDACVMDGPSGLGGAVASLRNIKNPAQVALLVMRRTDHVLLVAEGALRFARAHGFVEQNLLTESSRKKWLAWKERLSRTDDWIEAKENVLQEQKDGAAKDEPKKDPPPPPPRPTGTIHVGCVNEKGDLGGATSTSGLAYKIPGRVGDSPLLGCGNYVDNEVGVAGSTGRGEAVILANGSAFIVHMMRQGMTPTDACLAACKRIVSMTRVKRLLNARGLPDFNVSFYALNKAGDLGAASIYPAKHARCGENGPELADCASLF